MRWLVVVLALAACGGSSSAPASTWWCWPDTVCFADRKDCEATGRAIGTSSSCVARERAFCRRGCEPGEPGGGPSCGPRCGVDLPACEALGRDGTCREEAPPKHPEVFEYSEPGFWCYELAGPPPASWCTKHKPECEHMLDDTLAKVGLHRDAAAQCTRPTGPVHCWSRRVEGKLAFVCSPSREFCETTRAGASAIAKAAGQPLTDPSACAPWAYE